MAGSIGDELEAASKQAVSRNNAFWQLALDIARRSIDALGSGVDAAGARVQAGARGKAGAKLKGGGKRKK